MAARIVCPAFAVLILGCASPIVAADGTPDPTFAGDGRVTESFGSSSATAQAIAPFPNGSMLAGGSAQVGTVTTHRALAVVRYRQDGRVDLDWGNSGKQIVPVHPEGSTTDELLEIALDDTGAATLLAWTKSGSQRLPALVRLTPEGDLDTGFGVDGREVTEDGPFSVVTSSATSHLGGFLFAGVCGCAPLGGGGVFVYRTDADGQPDALFGEAGWVFFAIDEYPFYPRIGVRPDGGIVVAYTVDFGIIRLASFLADGSFDPDFGPNANGFASFLTGNGIWVPSDVAISPDGWIYIALRTTDDPGPMSGSVARVSASGELDEAFGFPDLTLEEGSEINAIAVANDSKIVAVGPINANGAQTGGFLVARLLTTGALDSTFDGNGVNRVEFDLFANSTDVPLAVALSGSKPVVAGFAARGAAARNPAFATLRLQNQHVFASGFEDGLISAWSGWVGYLP
jgi:uncharacterized delta-60 repeat protein